jgi:hypothetical protein
MALAAPPKPRNSRRAEAMACSGRIGFSLSVER